MEENYKEFYEWVDRIEKDGDGFSMFGRRVLVKLLEMRERIEQSVEPTVSHAGDIPKHKPTNYIGGSEM